MMNEKLVRQCLRMLRDRERHFAKGRNGQISNGGWMRIIPYSAATTAYGTAARMLESALNGNWDELMDYDLYWDEEED